MTSIATSTPIALAGLIWPVVIGFLLVALISLLREPARRKFGAVFVVGEGATDVRRRFRRANPRLAAEQSR